MEIKTLAELYAASAQKYGNAPAFFTKMSGGKMQAIGFSDLYQAGLHLATALLELGALPGENIGLFSDNCQEWMMASYGITLAGCADVPRGSDVTDQDISYILAHASCKILFVENEALLKKVQALRGQLPALKVIILLTSGKAGEGIFYIHDLVARGKAIGEKWEKQMHARIKEIKPDGLAILIYTSGTTGAPKGVMLSHGNILSQLSHIPVPVGPADRILSILPVWHIFERIFEIMAIASGAATYYTSIRTIREDMSSVRPTFMASAPRLWESVYQGILSKAEKSGALSRMLVRTAISMALGYARYGRWRRGTELDLYGRSLLQRAGLAVAGLAMQLILLIPFLILDVLVLRKIRNATGGKLRASISGGGALPYHIDCFFNAIGIPVLEGYGMTETSPVIAVRSLKKLVPGTVGPIYPQTDLVIRRLPDGKVVFDSRQPDEGIGEKGEIHVRGPQVMQGYYRNPEATERVFEDGWLNTGDLGLMTGNGCLKIVGRSKETIVLSGGENVEPVPIENKIIESPFVDNVMVVGQDQKFLGALVVPSTLAREKAGNSEELREIIRSEIKDRISKENGFKAFERLAGFALVHESWKPGEELTAKLSLKRHAIQEKYQDLIDEIYL